MREIYRRKIENQELSLLEFTQKKLELKSLPSKVIVEVNKYELWRHARRQNTPMTLELFRKAASSLFPTAYFVDLRGFETPEVAPLWHVMLKELELYPLINWHLFTHLTFTDPCVWPRIADLGFILGFALDGVKQKTVDTIRPGTGTDLALVKSNLAVLTRELARTGRGFLYSIVTIQKENLDELVDIVKLIQDHGIHQLQLKVMKGFTDEAASTGRVTDVLNECLAIAHKGGTRLTLNDYELLEGLDIATAVEVAKAPHPDPVLNFPLPFSEAPEIWRVHPWAAIDSRVAERSKVAQYRKCYKPYHYAHVANDGRVGTCNHMLDPYILEMGNLNTQSFEEIWNGEKYKAFRESLVKGQPTDPRCQWCFEHRLTD